MAKKELEKIREHEFDGIQEYDNKLPNWWLGTFILTVVFGFGYWLYYYNYQGPTLTDELQADIEAHEKAYAGKKKQVTISDEEILALLNQSAALESGKKLYMTHCASCHKADGTGGIGPNLIDATWVHGDKPSQIFNTISQGVLDKGMLAWKDTLKVDEIKNVTAFVLSLKK